MNSAFKEKIFKASGYTYNVTKTEGKLIKSSFTW